MSKPKRQRTVHVRIIDHETGFVSFGSIKVERNKITLNPTPGIVLPPITNGTADFTVHPPFDRLNDRTLRLGQLLQRRWFHE